MIAEFVVMFRETLEAAFVVGIILAYLHKTKNTEHEKHVWSGVGAGIVLSLILAYLFQFVQGGFESHEEAFEGVFMVATSLLVTWFLIWIVNQKHIVKSLQNEVKIALEKSTPFALFSVAFTSIAREGVESVLFMAGIFSSTGAVSVFGGLLGLAAAVVLGILVFEYAVKFNISLFFTVTTVLLVLLAAGLFSQGIHELQEARILPTFVEHIYDINPAVNSDGTFPLLHEKGTIGSIFKGLVGYDGDPSDLQVAGYLLYLISFFSYWKFSNSK